MKIFTRVLFIGSQFFLAARIWAATLYVDLNSANPTPPYASWGTAATNIQEAIDAATAGDLVLVTNGVYATGGKVKFGDLTNRVALDKAITVQSVNGPWFTTIRGAGATNGLTAVRCAWLTNGAELNGFMLTAGATRTSGDQTNLLNGGGALCLGAEVRLFNCLVISNSAQSFGGGVFQGQVVNSAILGNKSQAGSGVAFARLLNSTVVSNWLGAATVQSAHTNSIIYHNASGNYSGGTFAFSCTMPLTAGMSNISTAPQLFVDGVHLQSTSPCRSTGTNLTTGTDIDGQAWANPPSMGCDEWGGKPIIVSQPRVQLTNNPIGFAISVTAAGEDPLAYYWFHNGFPVGNDNHFSQAYSPHLVGTGVGEWSAGDYQVVVSNSFGVVTSAVAQLTARFVNVSNNTPAAPYTSWANAATNIQDAIDAASAGELVLVTNGIYRTGGKVMGGDLTNRVAIDKAITVQSVNGPEATIIEGRWNPTITNGPAAIRCVWMTNGAALNGFAIWGGATRAVSGSATSQMFGGGIWASSTNAIVYNSLIVSNTAGYRGGGAYQVTLINCTLIANRAVGSGLPGSGFAGAGQGGGAANSHLRNCIVRGNYADQGNGGGVNNSDLFNSALIENSSYLHGGAAYGGRLVNCTVTRNTSSGYGSYGAAINSALLTNCIVWENYSRGTYATNYANSTLAYCVSQPAAPGIGNLALDPQLLNDGVHVAETSPARAAGLNLTSGTDIDGEVWGSSPSIGCDEWTPTPRILSNPSKTFTYVSRRMTWGLPVAGQLPFSIQWFKNGQPIADDDHYDFSDTTEMVINKFGPEHAGQYHVVASNAFGVATSLVARVVIHCVDALASSSSFPYDSWATAANTIQDAVDAAQSGALVLVTNGVYATGGRVDGTGLTNRVIIDKAITVLSMNGYKATTIEGRWDIATNGPSAVRCVWLGDGATVAGFTIQNGATLTEGATTMAQHSAQAGGGVYSASVSSESSVVNCLLTNNSAHKYGGGAYAVRLINSLVLGNQAGSGGGVAYGELLNCTVTRNVAGLGGGGGIYGSSIVVSGGVYGGSVRARNSIIYGNYRIFGQTDNYSSFWSELVYCATPSVPQPAGTGNIFFNGAFVDSDFHLPAASVCRGAGSSLYASGEDMDGEPWSSPPSIGTDEVIDANLSGAISLSVNALRTNTLVGSLHPLGFWDSITGRVSRIDWDFGNGVVTNGSYAVSRTWTSPGNYTITSTAYNTDNPNGISASIDIQVAPVLMPTNHSVLVDSSGFKFAFEAQESARYTIQYATNLVAPITWRTLQTIISSPGGTTQITDPVSTNAARFYRVLAQ